MKTQLTGTSTAGRFTVYLLHKSRFVLYTVSMVVSKPFFLSTFSSSRKKLQFGQGPAAFDLRVMMIISLVPEPAV